MSLSPDDRRLTTDDSPGYTRRTDMPQYAFPADDYTPHGYLANPYAVAHSWSDGEGGCLRSSREHLGVGWQLPWALHASASADLIVALECDGEALVTRADFAACDLTSPHHTSQLLTYRWQAFGQAWDASFVLVSANELGVQIVWSPLPGADGTEESRPVRVTVGAVGWRQPDADSATHAAASESSVELGEPFGAFRLRVGDAWVTEASGGMAVVRASDPRPTALLETESDRAVVAATVELPATGNGALSAVLARVGVSGAASPSTEPVAVAVGAAIARARTADAAFWSKAARLVGDWPHHWRRGWVYDLETTRMCIFPPGGVFTDVWPAWMIQWPRAVVAEGTLDVTRLAYADPQLALRAALSLFRDTTADNIPCIFQHGEPNMVASDGSVCGTSPAWCVPFYNLERLYLLTLDREWLAAIYPHLVRYVEFWLRERTDADGWAVYKCTWEAGEDNTPRLDPERRGDNVVSAFVRPVELQATMALAAGVLARFAETLDKPEDTASWQEVELAFSQRTRSLWDPTEGRFRDWDARAGAFLTPSAPGETNYWSIDPCRYSALAFTPVLASTNDWTLLSDDQFAGLSRELRHYAGPPWTLWASWSYVVLEAATRLDERQFAGEIAAGIVERVYRELDTREIAAPSHPTPGVAREYWPLDLDAWASCEGYGWGANTASLLMRQVFGFFEGPPESDEYATPGAPGWRANWLGFSLTPNLPPEFLATGHTYRVANLPYRGAALDVGYRVETAGGPDEPARLTLLLSADVPTECAVTPIDSNTPRDTVTRPLAARHAVPIRNSARYLITLRPAPPLRADLGI